MIFLKITFISEWNIVHAGLGAVTWESFLHFFSSERSLTADSVMNPMCVQPMCTQPLCMQAAMCAQPMCPNTMCKMGPWNRLGSRCTAFTSSTFLCGRSPMKIHLSSCSRGLVLPFSSLFPRRWSCRWHWFRHVANVAQLSTLCSTGFCRLVLRTFLQLLLHWLHRITTSWLLHSTFNSLTRE